jgi:phytoene dehydrogenase-like protein
MIAKEFGVSEQVLSNSALFSVVVVRWFCGLGLMLGMLGHAVGWPIPRGGAQMISNALLQHLRTLGGKIQTGVFITSLSQLPRTRVILLDVTPRQLVRIAREKLTRQLHS